LLTLFFITAAASLLLEPFKIGQPENLTILGLQSIQHTMDSDPGFAPDILSFNIFQSTGQLFMVTLGDFDNSGFPPQVIYRQITADGIEPGFEGAFPSVFGLSCSQSDKSVLCQMDVIDEAVQKKDETILVIPYNLRQTGLIAVKKPAVIFRTPVHVNPLS
jgi:hypothetical protein